MLRYEGGVRMNTKKSRGVNGLGDGVEHGQLNGRFVPVAQLDRATAF